MSTGMNNALNDWLITTDKTDTEFARLIGVTQQAVGRYRTGQRIPRHAIMARIKRVTNGAVLETDFYEDVE